MPTTTPETTAPVEPRGTEPSRWAPVRLLLRIEHLRLLRRWAFDEDRPVELHMARLLRLAALEHAERQGATDAG